MKIQRCNYLEENQMAIIEDMDTLIHNITSSELKEKNIKITKLQQELQIKDNIINELKKELYHIYNYAGLETKELADKIKELENEKIR